MLGLHPIDALPERPDDPPAAHVGSGRNGEPGRDLDPGRDVKSPCDPLWLYSASAITPIVFCASFAPCVNASHVPEPS